MPNHHAPNYHVKVEFDDGWYVGRVLERAGVTTQGKSLDELVEMLRDAIKALWDESPVGPELVLTPSVAKAVPKKRRRKVA